MSISIVSVLLHDFSVSLIIGAIVEISGLFIGYYLGVRDAVLRKID